jgi:hypothetical protein
LFHFFPPSSIVAQRGGWGLLVGALFLNGAVWGLFVAGVWMSLKRPAGTAGGAR